MKNDFRTQKVLRKRIFIKTQVHEKKIFIVGKVFIMKKFFHHEKNFHYGEGFHYKNNSYEKNTSLKVFESNSKSRKKI